MIKYKTREECFEKEKKVSNYRLYLKNNELFVECLDGKKFSERVKKVHLK